MASKLIKGITIEIGADTVGLDKALKGVESAGRKASSELREIDKAMKGNEESAVLWEQKQKVLNTALDESKKKLKLLEEAQEQVNQQFRDNAISEEQYRAFERETEKARAEVEKLSGQLAETKDKVKSFGDQADNAAGEVDQLGDESEEAGKQADSAANGGFTVLKGALANLVADGIRKAGEELTEFATDVVKTGMSFESTMSGVGAVSGATADDMARLKAQAEEMGATTKFTATESAEAYQYMAMAGWKAEQMLSGLPGILDLAAASGEDLATTSDIVTDALTAFGLGAEDSGHFANVLAAASSNANTNVSMMGETFKYVAPIAGALKYSAEDTAVAIGLMANSGIKASQAGTSLRTIMSNLTDDFVVSGEAIGDVVIKTKNADGTMRGFSDIIADTREAFSGLTESEKANMAETLAGKNAMSGFLALVNAAPADVDKLTAAIADCDGAAESMSTTMIDNLSGDMTLFESAVDGMKIQLADELNPALRDVVQYATKQIPAAEKALTPVFKKGVDVLNFAVKNIPKAIDIAKGAIPVVTGIGAAFAIWGGTNGALSAISKADKAIKMLNTTMLANPALVVTAAVVGLTAAIVALSIASHDEESIASKVAEQYKEQHAAVEAVRDQMNGMKDDFSDRAGAIQSEYDRTETLWKELDKLADASGRVKDADKKRAEYILGELNEALGTEYSITGNQIDNYKQLEAEIDTVIAKKKAEAYLDDYLAMSSGMAQAKATSQAQYEEAYTKYQAAQSERSAAEKEYTRLTGFTVDEMSPEEFIDNYKGAGKTYSAGVAAAERLVTATANVAENATTMAESRANYMESAEYFRKLEEAEKAYAEERYDDIEGIVFATNDANARILKDESADLDKRREAFRSSIAKTTADLKLALQENSQSAVDMFMDALGETVSYGQLVGADVSEMFTGEFIAGVKEMADKGFDISGLTAWAKDSGIKVGDVFGDDYTKIVQGQLDKGYDITDLIDWGKRSGVDIGGMFSGEYYRIVQAQLDAGYDIEKLLIWGAESGTLTSDEYMRLFKENASNKLGQGFDTSSFMEWIGSLGSDAGDLYGMNFQSAYTRYLYDTNNLIPKNINSQSDYELWRSGGYGARTYAAGGFLPYGEQGIIAEAGPELLQIMNGGIKITPLSRSAQNTPVSSSGAQKLFYDNITIYATISNDYDVRRLGERLAAERKQIEIEKGLTT